MSEVIVERKGAARWLTLNRPERLNVVSHVMIAELLDALEDAATDDDCRVIVVSGSGRAFCAGDDLKGMGPVPPDRWKGRKPVVMPQQRLVDALRSLPKPVVAKLHGHVLGMGQEIALACDIRISTESTQFGDPRVDRALYAATGITYQLPRIIGYGRAMEMMLLGERIDGREAERRGLVYRAVADELLDSTTEEVVRRFSTAATKSVAVIKKQLRDQQDLTYEESARHSIWMRATYELEDGAEGHQAFFEKRAPRFTGR